MGDDDLFEGELSRSVIGAFYEVYNEMGHGFTETLHARGMQAELEFRGHKVAREVCVPVYLKGWLLGDQRIDMIVDGRLIIEIKSSQRLPKSTGRQLYNYLRCTDIEVGLILHFGLKAEFYRQIVTNDKKPRLRRGHTDLTDRTD
ncbi:MAG TPA: GxxExxY protein [Gemmatimonadaceae bacterium]|nr:GxxExxY protein [Gemmatimonadaceae bacterium]